MPATKPYTHSPLVWDLHTGSRAARKAGYPVTATRLDEAAEYIDALEGLVEAQRAQALFREGTVDERYWAGEVAVRDRKVQQLIKKHRGED